ncbi:MAG: hypothetical protein ACYS99_09025 [Planctomycetota bacterium]
MTFSDDGLSASANWTLDTTDDTLTITIENLTKPTLNAGDLLTAFGFSLSSGANPTLDEAEGDVLNIAKDGSVFDEEVGVDLLDVDGAGTASWSLISVSGGFELRFNPDAEHAIIGPAESDGTYSSANGGIKGNGGHNPFVDGVATFVLGVTGDPSLSDPYFLFGTDFDTRLVPLPPAALMGLLLLGGLGLAKRRLRRRNR